MPKPSAVDMHPDAAVESSGALAGKYEVLDSHFKVHQANQREGVEARGAVMALVLKVTPISDEGERLEDADTKDIVLGLGGKSLATFHPGKGSSPDDTDPEDLGVEPGTEGNTLYISGGAVSMNSASSYTVFTKSLQHRGFDPAKIAACWAPNYKGLKIDIMTVTPDKLEAYGQKKRDIDPKVPVTYKVVQAIIAQPDAKASGKSKKDSAAAPAPTPITNKQKAAAAPQASAEDSDSESGSGDEAETEAVRVLAAVVNKLAGKNKKLDQAKTFWITMYGDPKVKGKQPLQDKARKFVNDTKWLVSKLEDDFNCVVDAEEGTVTFAEAA